MSEIPKKVYGKTDKWLRVKRTTKIMLNQLLKQHPNLATFNDLLQHFIELDKNCGEKTND